MRCIYISIKGLDNHTEILYKILNQVKGTVTLPNADSNNALTSHIRYGFALVYTLLTHDQRRNVFI